MGRPNQCNPCCGNAGSGGSSEPQISDCEKVICVAFIDENTRSDSGANSFNNKMNLWRLAYPDRLLFVLDVQAGYYGGSVSYPSNFISWPKAFSLKLEYNKFYGGLIYSLYRDYGDIYTALQNDPWQRIKNIVNHYGGDVLQLFNSSREVSIFVDNSGSMTAIQVEATVEKLKQDAISDDKVIVSSISNDNEDIICPFIQTLGTCDTGSQSQNLQIMCGFY